MRVVAGGKTRLSTMMSTVSMAPDMAMLSRMAMSIVSLVTAAIESMVGMTMTMTPAGPSRNSIKARPAALRARNRAVNSQGSPKVAAAR